MSAGPRFFGLTIAAAALASALVFALINASAFASVGDFVWVLLLVVVAAAIAVLPNLAIWYGLLAVVRRRGGHYGPLGHALIAAIASLPPVAVAAVWLSMNLASATDGITRSLLPVFILPTLGVSVLCIVLAVLYAVWRERLGLTGLFV